MLQFFHSLSPEDWAIFAGLLAPFVHFLATRWISFENKHREMINWVVAFLIPAAATVLTYLATDPGFNKLVPLYGTVFATAQLVYLVSVRSWNENKVLRTTVQTLTTPILPEVASTETLL